MARKSNKRAPLDPRHLQSVLKNAVSQHQAGHLIDAERGYAEILKALPDQPDALNLSGLIAYQNGKNARAVMLLNKAVAARPNFADALNHLGLAHRKLGQAKQALAAFTEAVSADPESAEAHNNLGNARKDFDDLAGAATAYRRACDLAPLAVEPRYNLGNVLRDLEDHEGAITAYLQVLERAPNHVEAQFNLAGLRERSHELEQARIDLEKVLHLQSGLAPARILMAKILRRQKDFEAAESALIQCDATQLASDDAINLSIEKGKLFDLTGKPDAAFAAFTEANRLQSTAGGKKLVQTAEKFRQQVASELALVSEPEKWPETRDTAGAGLVFLMGFPRSGTTLLDQVLDAHPDVAVMEERPAVARMLAEARTLGWRSTEAICDLGGDDASRLRDAYFAEVDRHVARTEGQVLVDKMPLNIVHVLPLARLFPKAKFVLALRHPLDVILSNFMQLYRLNGPMANFLALDTAAETYDVTLRLWQSASAKLNLNVHEVRYESLITDMEGESRALLQFLGLDWTDKVLDPTGHARARKIINTPSYEQVAEPIYQRANGRWTRYEPHLQPVRALLDPWVERLGYATKT